MKPLYSNGMPGYPPCRTLEQARKDIAAMRQEPPALSPSVEPQERLAGFAASIAIARGFE